MLEGLFLTRGINECLREGELSFRGGGRTSKSRGKEIIRWANEFVCVGVALGATVK